MFGFNEDVLSALVVPAGLPPWHGAARAATVHVGHSLCLLRRPDGVLLPVTGGDHGLVPGGVLVPEPAEFAVVSAAAARGELDLARLRSARAIETRELRVRPGRLRPAAARLALARLAGQQPVPQWRLAGGLVRSLADPDRRELASRLAELVGSGPGSTPAGDDIVLGVLAVLHRRGPAAEATRLAIGESLPGLLRRTTMTSRHLLAAALAGLVADRVHQVLAGLSEADAVPGLLSSARGWGATSGLDLVTGAASAILGTQRMFSAGRAGEVEQEERVA